MKKSDLRNYTVKELRQIVRENDLAIAGAWKMKKDDLVEEIFDFVFEAWQMVDDEAVVEKPKKEDKKRGRKTKSVQILKDGKEVIKLNSQKEACVWARENRICNEGWVKESLRSGRETAAGRKFKEGGYLFRYI